MRRHGNQQIPPLTLGFKRQPTSSVRLSARLNTTYGKKNANSVRAIVPLIIIQAEILTVHARHVTLKASHHQTGHGTRLAHWAILHRVRVHVMVVSSAAERAVLHTAAGRQAVRQDTSGTMVLSYLTRRACRVGLAKANGKSPHVQRIWTPHASSVQSVTSAST